MAQKKGKAVGKQGAGLALQEIPGARIAELAAKEIRLIKSQKIALVLIMLYPLLVIGSLGLAFAGNTTTKVNAGFFAEQEMEGFDSEEFIKMANDSNKAVLTLFDTEDGLIKAVRSKEMKVGIALKGVDKMTKRFILNVYFDNSNIIGSELYFEEIKTQLQIFGFQKTRGLISEIWGKLGGIKEKIDGEAGRVDEFILTLDSSEDDLNRLESNLDSLDVGDAERAIERQKSQLGPFYSELEQMQKDIDAYEEKLDRFDKRAESIQATIGKYREKIGRARLAVEDAEARLGEMQETVRNENIAMVLSELSSLNSELSALESDLEAVDSELSGARSEIAELKENLAENRQKIGEVRVKSSETMADLDAMGEFAASLGATVEETKDMIADAREQKKAIEEKLLESKSILLGFIDSLSELEKITPEFLSNPFVLNKKPLFGTNRLALVTPTAIAIVLLLTTVLLTGVSFVTEKKEGPYTRMLLSTTSTAELFAGKILGQLAFGLIEAGIIIAIALTVFSTTVPRSPLEVVLAITIITLNFISLGLLITNFTKNQSTTILASLILMIPMLFLSGMLLPLELMNPAIQWIAQFLPLTAGNAILVETMVKGNPLASAWPELLILLVPFAAILLFTIINKKTE